MSFVTNITGYPYPPLWQSFVLGNGCQAGFECRIGTKDRLVTCWVDTLAISGSGR